VNPSVWEPLGGDTRYQVSCSPELLSAVLVSKVMDWPPKLMALGGVPPEPSSRCSTNRVSLPEPEANEIMGTGSVLLSPLKLSALPAT